MNSPEAIHADGHRCVVVSVRISVMQERLLFRALDRRNLRCYPDDPVSMSRWIADASCREALRELSAGKGTV